MKKIYQIVCFYSLPVYITPQMGRSFQSYMQMVFVIYLLGTGKEVRKIGRQNILGVLQKGESGSGGEFTCIGPESCKEQTQESYQSQQLALRRYRRVEAKENRLLDILESFLKSPYMAFPIYILHLKQLVWLCYHVRSHTSWQASDEEPCEILYEGYPLYHGEISQQLILCILQRVKKPQEEQCIRYIVGKQRVRDSLYVLLQHAQETRETTKKRRGYLLEQCEQLAQKLVLLLNRGQDAFLSMTDHKYILNTINYAVLQGLEKIEERFLQELEVDTCFERNLLVLQDRKQQTRNLLNQLRRNHLPFCNERYSSVMDEQIPYHFEQLSAYEGILYYDHITEGLDYPLVDGIPLFHDMYHLDGMDLVLYYMERFALKHTFCEYLQEELLEFLRHYEQQKEVTVEYLGLNLCELLWYQCFVSLMLLQQPSLLLAEQDVKRLRTLLRHCSLQEAIGQVHHAIAVRIRKSVIDYLTLFEEQLQTQLQVFVQDACALLVHEEAVDGCFVIDLTQGKDEEAFLALLEEVEEYTYLQGRIQYLRSQKISAYDLIDLLENVVFISAKYDAYYEQLSLEKIAVLLKLLHPAGGNFHETWKLNDADLEKIEQEQEWQSRLIRHIRRRSQREREILCGLLNELRIHS